MNNELSELSYWLQGYLNQDFDAVHGSVDNALIAYKTEASSENIEELKHDLAVVIQSNQTEEELSDLLLTQLGSSYYYLSEWESAMDWLRHLQKILNQ